MVPVVARYHRTDGEDPHRSYGKLTSLFPLLAIKLQRSELDREDETWISAL
jgi:hypothetical protein